jgi:hypothetical protein
MSKCITVSDTQHPADLLCQCRDELRVIWLALGNEEDKDGYRVEIREHVNGIANRVAEIIKGMGETK